LVAIRYSHDTSAPYSRSDPTPPYVLTAVPVPAAMYPGFAKTAREEGFEELADWFATLARAEKTHAGRFRKGLEKVAGTATATA
jgi:hypothetical protein